MRFENQPGKPAVPALGMIYGGVLALGAALAVVWLRFGLPLPVCLFHHWTSLPCPTCGSSRMVRALLAGDIAGAASLNPLVFSVFVLVSGWAVLSTVQVLFRLPQRRIVLAPWERIGLRVLAVAALAVGWGYLVWRGV